MAGAFKCIGDAVISIDVDNKIDYMNVEAERLTGAHLDEAYRFFLIKLEEERREQPDITF